MNQMPRYVKMICVRCKKNEAWAHEVYDSHIADYEIMEAPICEKCREREKNEHGLSELI